jgi:hypothetical protein
MSQATMLIEEVIRPRVREIPVFQGLCRDCVNAPACTFPRDPSRPVRSCDEFAATELARDRQGPFVSAARVFAAVSSQAAPEPGNLKGLCRQCARRSSCTFPKPPEGVWHCDELA